MDKEIILSGIKLHYSDNGDSDHVIILMHGWGCDHTTLLSLERIALECGYRVISVDFPGFGASEEPPSIWGVEEYTRVIEELVSSLDINNPVLLGHSFGGRVGILYSSRHADVSKLILVDAAGIKPVRTFSYYRKVYTYKLMKRFMYILFGREGAERRLESRRAKVGSSDYASASPIMRGILSKVVNEDLTNRLSSISAPTLLIWGENDTATPLSDARKMEKLIPDAGLVAFAGCGHYSFLDNPCGTKAVLQSFLNDRKD